MVAVNERGILVISFEMLFLGDQLMSPNRAGDYFIFFYHDMQSLQ